MSPLSALNIVPETTEELRLYRILVSQCPALF